MKQSIKCHLGRDTEGDDGAKVGNTMTGTTMGTESSSIMRNEHWTRNNFA
jgi:hypothetical protein